MPLIRRAPPAPRAPDPDRAKLAITLESGTEEERWIAARVAAETSDGLQLLADALPKETNPRVREAIFTGFARIGTSDSAGSMLPYLRSDDAQGRTGALDALRAMPADAVKPHISSLLHDADPDVRLLACELLRSQPAEEASRFLDDLLVREDKANVCAAAVEVLAETGTMTDLPALAQCALRFPNDPFLAFAIQLASQRIGSR